MRHRYAGARTLRSTPRASAVGWADSTEPRTISLASVTESTTSSGTLSVWAVRSRSETSRCSRSTFLATTCRWCAGTFGSGTSSSSIMLT